MRRLVVALIVAVMAFSLAGCGGGEEEAPATTEAPPPPPAVAPADADPIADRSAEESPTFTPFPAGEGVPESVAERIADKQPMLLLFFDDDQKDTDDTQAEVKLVIDANKGLVDLLTYDVGKYSSVRKDGTVVVDESGLSEDEKAKESILLARALGVTFTPYIVIVDDQGYIIYRHSGYVDSELLERQVLRVTE